MWNSQSLCSKLREMPSNCCKCNKNLAKFFEMIAQWNKDKDRELFFKKYKWGPELQIQTLVSGFYLLRDNIQTVYCKYTITVQAQNTIIVLVKTSKTPCSPYSSTRETYTILALLESHFLDKFSCYNLSANTCFWDRLLDWDSWGNKSLKAPVQTFSKEAISQISWVFMVWRF